LKNIYSSLLEHINNNWPDSEKEIFTWELGRIKKILPIFRVVRVAPQSNSEPWVYLTHGAWEVDFGKNYRNEFFVVCPFEDPRHVETLAMLATFHADPKYHLEVGRSVNIGRGWLEGSEYDHFLVSLPYPYGPDLEICNINDILEVRYRWLLPINRAENELLLQAGLENLEQKFDDAEIDYLDPFRPAVA
jgi:hypothetical protein